MKPHELFSWFSLQMAKRNRFNDQYMCVCVCVCVCSSDGMLCVALESCCSVVAQTVFSLRDRKSY